MPLKGVACIKGFVDMAEHRRCMVEEDGPPCGIPPDLLELMTRPNKERGETGIKFSPSTLGACHRQSVLSGRHDWYLPVDQGYKMVRGSVVHAGFEHEPPWPGILGVVRELRMNAPIKVRGQEERFHGKADLIVLSSIEHVFPEKQAVDDKGNLLTMQAKTVLHVKLVDYKTKGEVSHSLTAPDHKHVEQVNEYAWLIQKYIPGWLNECDQHGDPCSDHLKLNPGVTLPHIDEVVVDELSIVYMDMDKPRTFTSKGFLYARGKMLGAKGSDGRWHRYNPVQYDELALEPIHMLSTTSVESLIRKGIADQIDAETVLAAPLTGDDASLMCRSCPVLGVCYQTGKREGYSMEGQESFVSFGDRMGAE